MVQADIFWTFAIGSSFAVSASRQLKKEKSPFDNRYFVRTLLFLCLLVLPSVIYLMTLYPGWETMYGLYPYMVHVEGPAPGVIPPTAGLVVALFMIIYVLCTMLGFYLAYRCIQEERMKTAHGLWIVGYFLTFFMMFFGWDGTGWERFIFAGTWEEWHAWKVLGGVNPYTWKDFISSPIFYSLLVMGALVLPPMAVVHLKWPREGRDAS